MPKSYSKTEIDGFHNLIHEKLSQIREDLVVVREQTIKTNGRVSRLEKIVMVVLGALGATGLWLSPEITAKLLTALALGS